MTDIALLPCPHCSGKAELHTHQIAEDAVEAFVMCSACFATTDNFEDTYAPTADAIAAWNRRASPSQVAPQPQAGGLVGYLVQGFDGEPFFAPDREQYDRQGHAVIPVYASPQPANPAQVTDAMTPESYVADYIAHGERSVLPLPAWEKAYQDAGLIDEAQNLGYIWLGSDVACTVEVTAHGRTAAELHRVRAALTAAIGAGGQAVAEAREHDIKELIKLAGERQLVDGVALYDRSLLKSLANVLEETLSQPHPADERVVEALRECVTYIRSPLRMTRDEDEEVRRARVIDRAVAALEAAIGAEDPRWQKLRDLFGLDGWHDGLWSGIPNPDQIINHIEHIANERARLLKAHIDAQPEAAIGAGGQAVAVKALEWYPDPGAFPAPTWGAQSSFGRYTIEEVSASDSPAYEVRYTPHHLVAIKDGLDEAKDAAQADYERRIRSALSQPHPADERVEPTDGVSNKAEEGRQAYKSGQSKGSNPYPQGTARYWQWSSGWLDERAFRPRTDERVVEALRKIEYCLTKDSLCEAEKIDDALKAVRRLIAAKEGR